MPIIKQDEWDKCVAVNGDPYSKACVDVAREVMRILDEEPGQVESAEKLVNRADNVTETGGITGFMAGCVAQMVSTFHSRGDEFRRSWNEEVGGKEEGERVNESGGVINPAIFELKRE